MYKNIALGLTLVLFAGCANTSNVQEIEQKEQIEQPVIIELNAIETKENIDQAEVKVQRDYSFDGEWLGNRTTRFLQRKFIIQDNKLDDIIGKLELSYLSPTNEVVVANEFEVMIKQIDERLMAIIKDIKTNNTERVFIIRDSDVQFRIVSELSDSLFFDEDYMVFKKVDKQKEGLEPVLEVEKEIEKTELIWEDSKSSKYLQASFENARLYCQRLENNWRLPTKEESKDLLNETIKNFKYKEDGCYWSSTQSIDDMNSAWCFDYNSKTLKLQEKNEQLYIRCVKEIER